MAKTTRKELLNPQDEFITTTSSTVKWIKENPSRFAIIIIIVLAVFASGFGFFYWKTSRESAAMVAYANAWKSSQITLDIIQNYSDTKAGKLSKLRLARMSYNENKQKMADDYARGFIEDWGQEDVFHWQGTLILAAEYLNERQYEKTVSLLADCVKESPKNIKDQALFYTAQAFIGLGKKEEARKALSGISENFRDIATPSLASLERHQGVSVDAKQ